jgi:hypothetical protein
MNTRMLSVSGHSWVQLVVGIKHTCQQSVMNTHMLSLSGHSRVQLPDDIHQRNTAVYLQLGDAWLRQAAEHATAYAQQRSVLGKWCGWQDPKVGAKVRLIVVSALCCGTC